MISNWTLPNICKDSEGDSDITIGSYNKNIQQICSENSAVITDTLHINGTVHNITATPGVVPIHKIPPKIAAAQTATAKIHRKMPAFRGRRGWCGCLKVSWNFFLLT